jgi:hypothetical protein
MSLRAAKASGGLVRGVLGSVLAPLLLGAPAAGQPGPAGIPGGSADRGGTAAQGSWSNTAPLGTPRAYHSATLLPDGKVLVAGGCDKYGEIQPTGIRTCVTPTVSAEMYDPAKGTWSPAGQMAVARMGHSATLLRGGKVLVAGGCTDADPGFLPCKTATPSAEIFDTSSGKWSPAAPMKMSRMSPSAVLIKGRSPQRCGSACGKVLVLGKSPEIRLLSGNESTELYDPASNTWSEAPPVPGRSSVCCAKAVALTDGLVGLIGGATALESGIFNPKEGAWRPMAESIERTASSAAGLPEGRILVSGGVTPDSDGTPVPSAEILEPGDASGKAPAWAAAGRMSVGRAIHTSTTLADGRILVTGGAMDLEWLQFANASPQPVVPVPDAALLKSTEIFDPRTGRWLPAGDLVRPRGVAWFPNHFSSQQDSRPSNYSVTALQDGRALLAGGDRIVSLTRARVFPALQDREVLGSVEIFTPAGWRRSTQTDAGGSPSPRLDWRVAGTGALLGSAAVVLIVFTARRRRA